MANLVAKLTKTQLTKIAKLCAQARAAAEAFEKSPCAELLERVHEPVEELFELFAEIQDRIYSTREERSDEWLESQRGIAHGAWAAKIYNLRCELGDHVYALQDFHALMANVEDSWENSEILGIEGALQRAQSIPTSAY